MHTRTYEKKANYKVVTSKWTLLLCFYFVIGNLGVFVKEFAYLFVYLPFIILKNKIFLL
jgi:hypothetical protein